MIDLSAPVMKEKGLPCGRATPEVSPRSTNVLFQYRQWRNLVPIKRKSGNILPAPMAPVQQSVHRAMTLPHNCLEAELWQGTEYAEECRIQHPYSFFPDRRSEVFHIS